MRNLSVWQNAENNVPIRRRLHSAPHAMAQPSPNQSKLQNLLRELFQLNQPDLDFGLYRIMHAKAQEIEQFLNEDLLATIQQRLGGNKTEKVKKAKAAYEHERQNAIDYGGNPDTAPKAMQSLAEYKAAQESQDDDEDLYEQLYRFFERYYDGGDFLSRRYYGRETSEKGAPYAVPYDGSEVYLHWANKDQYYIKTTESFRQFSVDLAQAKLNADELFTSRAPGKLHFALVEAEEGVHNNVKAANDKERYFIVDTDAPLEWQGDDLTVRFHYGADEEKPAKGRNWREERNSRNESTILAALEKQSAQKGEHTERVRRYHQALNADIPKGKDGTQKLLAKYLNQYTAKNSMDYFIHKDLGGFLKRELDYYLKNELFRLDELGSEKQPNTKNYERQLQKALTLREVAHKLIEFLAQTEEFQKKLWLKKKFVVDTQWLVTLDKVPASLYPQIEANETQWTEWEKLGFVAAKAKRIKLLNPGSKLVLDTQFFDADFTAQLLEYIGNTTGSLDEATDGVLIHSENVQALNLIQSALKGEVKNIYIDPPYNTGNDGFLYKDSYSSSSWMSMIDERLELGVSLLARSGVMFVSIGDEEQENLSSLVRQRFGKDNYFANLVWEKKKKGSFLNGKIVRMKDYILCVSKIAEESDGLIGEINSAIETYPVIKTTNARGVRIIRAGIASKFREPSHFLAAGTRISSGNMELILRSDLDIKDGLLTQDVEVDSNWIYGQDSLDEYAKEGTLYITQDLYFRRIVSEPRSKRMRDLLPRVGSNGEGDFTSFDINDLNKFGWGTNEDANDELHQLLGEQYAASYPKPSKLLTLLLASTRHKNGYWLDYFAGSGTTAHAVLNLNRADHQRRKYVLVEQGEYFDTVLKPRIAKVIYSSDWKDGKPTAPETGISQLVKIIRLESYEDTLNNLHVKEASAQSKVVAVNPALRQDYFLHYLLELETQGSPSLLNVAQFADPTAYTLRVKQPGSDAQAHRTVDLVETFNWLLGLRVSKLFAPQVFTAKFGKERDAELGKDAEPRRTLKAPLSPASSEANGWWFRTVQGIEADGRAVWVVWRKLTSDPAQDNLVLEAYLREQMGFDVRKLDGAPCSVLYVNGSHALPNMPHCEMRQLEEAFHRLMWDVKDA